MKEGKRDGRLRAASRSAVLWVARSLGARVLLEGDDLVDAAGGEDRHREGLALLERVEDLL